MSGLMVVAALAVVFVVIVACGLCGAASWADDEAGEEGR